MDVKEGKDCGSAPVITDNNKGNEDRGKEALELILAQTCSLVEFSNRNPLEFWTVCNRNYAKKVINLINRVCK